MSEQTTPRTYRDILTPIVGAAALSAAESRVYDLPAPKESIGHYMCRDGYCALGIILRALSRTPELVTRFPVTADVVDAARYGPVAYWATEAIINANDHGRLATPGSLTTLLDSNVPR